jgi:DNA-binding protein YbaB
MSLFEMTAGSRYVKLVFDARELSVLRAACTSVTEKEHDKLDDMTAAGLEQAARQARKATDSDMAGRLVELFRPGQEILIEKEDLEPVLESLKIYKNSAPEEQAGALQSALEKIEQHCR